METQNKEIINLKTTNNMKTKALLALNNFIHINKLQNYPLMRLMNILEYCFNIQQQLGYYLKSWRFEDFLCTLQGDKWSEDNWEFWKNMHAFQGELNDYRQTMSLEDAINELVAEYDL